MKINESLTNIWGEEYDFPLKKDGKTHPEYKKILNLLYENETLKARVKFLEESHYYDGYKFRNKVVELKNKIKELENENIEAEYFDEPEISEERFDELHSKITRK